MSDFNADHAELQIPCPQCGQKTNRTIGSLKAKPEVTCTACGHVRVIETADFEERLRAAQKNAEAALKAIKGFGKRR